MKLKNVKASLAVAGPIILIGVLLLIVGITFAFSKGVAWPTPAGYILFGLGVITGGYAIVGPKTLAWVGLALGGVGALILFLHYIGSF